LKQVFIQNVVAHLKLEIIMNTNLIGIVPVLPSSAIQRDISWYQEKVGFEPVSADKMYAILKKDEHYIHLQWHADTEEDPLLGGSVIRVFVKNIQPLFKEFVKRGTVKKNNLKLNTDWKTNEFGFYDLNNNAIFLVEEI